MDAGPQIGLGHLQRCISLAIALRNCEAVCLFLTNDDHKVRDRITRFGFDGYTLNTIGSWDGDDLVQTITMAANHKCGAIVVDSDYEGAEYLRRLRSVGFFVCAIEDIAPHPFPCQMVVNGDAHARQLHYYSSSGDTCFLLGSEYSILRPEFSNTHPRLVSDIAENILVTLGGADPHNLMPRLLELLGEVPGAFAVTAVIGPFFDNLAEIVTVAESVKRPVKLVPSPDSVHNLMLEADLAVSAGGQTLYELACIGCPTVAIRMAANQDGQLQVFSEAGFVTAVGCAEDIGVVNAVVDILLPLLADPKKRGAMSAAGQQLIDGQGALRVAQAILTEAQKKTLQQVCE